MIFVSSSCVRTDRISDSVRQLADRGYRCIELSGGTQRYDGLQEDLISLRAEYGLHYRCHNYFPPPQNHFVLNLASSDNAIRERTLDHVREAAQLCAALDIEVYSIHAGFRIDIAASDVGRGIPAQELSPLAATQTRFRAALREVTALFGPSVLVYVENNVLSQENHRTFGGQNPFLMTHAAQIVELLERCEVRLLLDVGHLQVSAQSLGLSLADELDALLARCDYVHISDNDGRADTNQPLLPQSPLYRLLWDRRELLHGKAFTVEVYAGMRDLEATHSSLEELLHA